MGHKGQILAERRWVVKSPDTFSQVRLEMFVDTFETGGN